MRSPFFIYPLLLLHLFLGVGAFFGGGLLVIRPDGSLLNMERGWLDNTPFHSYLIPGLILFTLNGLLPLFTLTGLFWIPDWPWANLFNIYPNRHWAWTYSFYSGIIVITWITVQLIITQYFWIQPVMIFTGLLIIVCTMIPSVMNYYKTE